MSALPPFDPSRAVGLLLGASEWPEMPTLRAGGNKDVYADTADYYYHLLTGPTGIGLSPANVLSLFDSPAQPGEQFDHLAHFINTRAARIQLERQRRKLEGGLQEVVLVYVGHGASPKDAGSRYHLYPRAAQPGLPYTLIEPLQLRQVLLRAAPESRCFLIVDACFAGNVEETFRERGNLAVALLCAVDSHTQGYARPGEAESTDPTYTLFTMHLAATLRTGLPGAGPKLGLHPIAEAVKKRMKGSAGSKEGLPFARAPRAEDQDLLHLGLFPNPPGAVGRNGRAAKGAVVQPDPIANPASAGGLVGTGTVPPSRTAFPDLTRYHEQVVETVLAGLKRPSRWSRDEFQRFQAWLRQGALFAQRNKPAVFSSDPSKAREAKNVAISFGQEVLSHLARLLHHEKLVALAKADAVEVYQRVEQLFSFVENAHAPV